MRKSTRLAAAAEAAALETKKQQPIPVTKPKPKPKPKTTTNKSVPISHSQDSILAKLIKEVEEDNKLLDNPLMVDEILNIIKNSGFLKKSYTSDIKEKFLKDCWTFYSGNPLSYMINKYMYLQPNNKLELDNPNYTVKDFIILYQHLPTFQYYIQPLIEQISQKPLRGRSVPIDMNILMELLIIGLKQITHLKDKHPEFFTTSQEIPTLYRGFRLTGENTDMLIRSNQSFISTTSNINIALQHAKPIENTSEKGILIIYEFASTIPLVKVNKIYTDILISAFTQQSEEEYLLLPGYKFKLIETGIFRKKSTDNVYTFETNKKSKEEIIQTDSISIPYYKIRVGINTPQ